MGKSGYKFNGSNLHYMAILHMIGQCETVFKECAVISDVANWMNVSKTTARKYLLIMSKDLDIVMTIAPYKTFGVTNIVLSYNAMQEYKQGAFKDAYNLYAQRVMGVILQDA